jgi:WXG100 family type VII secretion target
MLQVDPEELEQQAARIESLAEQLSDEIRNANAELAGVTWQGQSQLAYQSLFDDTTTQVERTAELVRAVGQTLRAAKDGIIEADEAIGSRIIS